VAEVYLTGEMADGKETPFIDLVVVGDIDKEYFEKLATRAEKLLNKKVRTAIYSKSEFSNALLQDMPHVCVYNGEWGSKSDI
jgi:predicted nucleotidyltransferase